MPAATVESSKGGLLHFAVDVFELLMWENNHLLSSALFVSMFPASFLIITFPFHPYLTHITHTQ